MTTYRIDRCWNICLSPKGALCVQIYKTECCQKRYVQFGSYLFVGEITEPKREFTFQSKKQISQNQKQKNKLLRFQFKKNNFIKFVKVVRQMNTLQNVAKFVQKNMIKKIFIIGVWKCLCSTQRVKFQQK